MKERLERFIEQTKREYESTLAEWYKESKYYRKPTLRDLFGEEIGGEVRNFQTQLEAGRDTERFIGLFEGMAKAYGASWFDEDLNQVRSGWE